MNYTKNYRLPQWVKEDRIMMEDFNAAMASIESGIDGAKSEAKQDAAALSTRIDKAQSSADEARRKPYAAGRYLGTGQDQTISTGFRPSFVIVCSMRGSDSTLSTESYDRYFAMTGGFSPLQGRLDITDTGFIARAMNDTYSPILTEYGRMYDYIAFR